MAAAHAGYEKMLAEEKEKPEVIQRAHRNFLREVVYLLYTHNRAQEAARWMAVLKQAYPEAVPASETVDQFALKRMTQTISDLDHSRTRSLVFGLLRQHFDNLVIDEDDRAAGFLSMARRIWQYYDSGIQSRKGALSLPPVQLLNGPIAVLIGIVYNYLPLMVFPIYVSLERLDPALVEASKDLGASRWATFRQVTWPLALPGVATGVLLVFVPLTGEWVIPSILGGGKSYYLGTFMANQVTDTRNWPLGSAAIAVLVLLATVVLLVGGKALAEEDA